MLNQHALELEGANAVIAGLVHVIGPSHVRDVAVRVATGDVARVVARAGEGAVIQLLVGAARRLVARQQTDGTLGLVLHTDLTLLSHLAAGGIHQDDVITRQRTAHGAGLEFLTRRITDQHGGLGLTETVTDRQAPGVLDVRNYFGIKWLAGT